MVKVNPNYPDTSTRGPETPIGVLVRKVDKNYDKDRSRDLAYKFSRRRFFEDPLAHGAYLLTGDITPDFQTSRFATADFAASDFADTSLAQQAREQNGFDDPPLPDPMEGAVYKGR